MLTCHKAHHWNLTRKLCSLEKEYAARMRILLLSSYRPYINQRPSVYELHFYSVEFRQAFVVAHNLTETHLN